MLKKPLLLLLGLTVAAPAAALTIRFPADKTFVTHSSFLVIQGGKTPVLDGMVVEINGVKSDLIDVADAEFRASFDDFLILQPTWDPGKNRLTAYGYVAGKEVAKESIEFFYAERAASPLIPATFKPFVMHTAEREAPCQPCHNMQPTKAELNSPNAASFPCTTCHRQKIEKKYVHGPVGSFSCVDCHDADSRPARYAVRNDGSAKLCMDCHSDKLEEYQKRKFIHGPVAVGQCLACHDAHASDQPQQLHAKVNALCSTCHDQIKVGDHVVRGVAGKPHPLEGKVNPSQPDRPLNCASCHDPHGSDSRYFFKGGAAGRMALCLLCHKK